MKKTYIIPNTKSIVVSTSAIIAGTDSVGFNSDAGNKLGSEDILVKEQRPDNYNVWGNDWSK